MDIGDVYMQKRPVLLISFYNQNALGVRYLDRALMKAGYESYIIYYKEFNSINPQEATEKELNLLQKVIEEIEPCLIGLSVMSSLYMDTVIKVYNAIKTNSNIAIVWGGVYATLFPEECMRYADFVIRGEGENAIVELADAITYRKSVNNIPNLVFTDNKDIIINEVRPLIKNIDQFDYPIIRAENKFLICHNRIYAGDPQLRSVSYELTASRGCPFACSYCSSVNLKRIYKNKGIYLRYRSVSSVIEELVIAKSEINQLKKIHFWDEIFPDNKEWVDEFAYRYKKEIKLPFQIWSHPLKVNESSVKRLVDAGLFKIVMGIQSGSPRIRREIFNRTESQEDILRACKVLNDCMVPQIVYDFILQHPFETEEDIRKTYEMCERLPWPFELQLHGLNFLPGTDIIEKAICMHIMSREEINSLIHKPMQQQYNMIWKYKSPNLKSNFWFSLIYMTQFALGRPVAKYLAQKKNSGICIQLGIIWKIILKPVDKSRNYINKGKLVLSAVDEHLPKKNIQV